MFSDSESSQGDPGTNKDEVHIESLPEEISTLNITEEAEANAKEETAATGRRISLNDEPKNGKKKEREKRRKEKCEERKAQGHVKPFSTSLMMKIPKTLMAL